MKKKAKRKNIDEIITSGHLDSEIDVLSLKDGIDFKKRIITIGNIENGGLTTQIFSLLKMDSENNKPITLLIRSNGGDFEESLIFINILKTINSNINTISFDSCQSAGFLIFCQGEKRSAFKNTQFLVHEISLDEEGLSRETLMQRSLEIELENDYIIKNIISKSSNKKLNWWKNKIEKAKDHDFYFDENQAKKYKIINHQIFDENNKFNLK